MILSHTHPAAIVGHVIDPIRNRLAEFLVDKIVHLDPLRVSLQPPLSTAVAKLPDQFLFFVSTDTTGCLRR